MNHKNSIAYFAKQAALAPYKYIRDYWLRRKEGAEAQQKRLEKDLEAKRKLKEREESLKSFSNCLPPEVSLDMALNSDKKPVGCTVRWTKPTNWEPDTYIVLVKNDNDSDYRSVASSNMSREARRMVLTKSFLTWGEYKEPYYIKVAAVKNGVGRKESEVLTYPTPITYKDKIKKTVDDINRLQSDLIEKKTLTHEEKIKEASDSIKKINDRLKEIKKEENWEKLNFDFKKPKLPHKKIEEDKKEFLKAEENKLNHVSDFKKIPKDTKPEFNQRLEDITFALNAYDKRPKFKQFRKELNVSPPVTFKEYREVWRQLKKRRRKEKK